jgi:hypothetical protein
MQDMPDKHGIEVDGTLAANGHRTSLATVDVGRHAKAIQFVDVGGRFI